MDIKQVYESIMAELRSLPGAIAEAERNESAVTEAAGGWSAMGKNEGERGMNLVSMMAQAGHPTTTETRKRFDSAVSQASLTAAMLRYLAKQCESETADFDIDTTQEQITASANGNGKADAETLSMFGL